MGPQQNTIPYELIAQFPLEPDEKILCTHSSKPYNYIAFKQIIFDWIKGNAIDFIGGVGVLTLLFSVPFVILTSIAPDPSNLDIFFYLKYLGIVSIEIFGVWSLIYSIHSKDLRKKRMDYSDEILSNYKKEYIITTKRILIRSYELEDLLFLNLNNNKFQIQIPDKFCINRKEIWSIKIWYEKNPKIKLPYSDNSPITKVETYLERYRENRIETMLAFCITPPLERYSVYNFDGTDQIKSFKNEEIFNKEDGIAFEDVRTIELTQNELRRIAEILIPAEAVVEEIDKKEILFVIQNPFESVSKLPPPK